MMMDTIWRARTMIERHEVIQLDDSNPPDYFHFQVKQRNGSWTDVWYEKDRKTGVMAWNCNAVETKTNGKTWGCVMKVGGKDKPYCSHTLACSILMKNREVGSHEPTSEEVE